MNILLKNPVYACRSSRFFRKILLNNCARVALLWSPKKSTWSASPCLLGYLMVICMYQSLHHTSKSRSPLWKEGNLNRYLALRIDTF